MKYTGRVTLITISILYFFISMIIFGESIILKLYTLFLMGAISIVFGTQYDRYKFLSQCDFLTEVYNRRFVYNAISKLVSKRQPFDLYVLDIDQFKQLNDQYGHTCGDNVLKTVAQVLKKISSRNDTVARWGGDEFLFISTSFEKDQIACLLEEEMRTNLIQFNILIEPRVSIGKASFPQDGTTLDVLIRKADQEMYKDKIGIDSQVYRSY